jgi:hypothetical protein
MSFHFLQLETGSQNRPSRSTPTQITKGTLKVRARRVWRPVGVHQMSAQSVLHELLRGNGHPWTHCTEGLHFSLAREHMSLATPRSQLKWLTVSYDLEVLRSALEVLKISARLKPEANFKGVTRFSADTLRVMGFTEARAQVMQVGFDLGVLRASRGHGAHPKSYDTLKNFGDKPAAILDKDRETGIIEEFTPQVWGAVHFPRAGSGPERPR